MAQVWSTKNAKLKTGKNTFQLELFWAGQTVGLNQIHSLTTQATLRFEFEFLSLFVGSKESKCFMVLLMEIRQKQPNTD